MSANAGGDDEEENGLQNSRLSSFQMSVEDPNGYDDEKNYDDGEVFKGDSADAEAEFSLPVCPVKVAGCHGYTESITRGTAWLRGTDDDPEEDAYIENELTVKPPVCYAFSFVGAYIGEKIISRALLLSGQVYHNTCIQAGLPHSITRPYYSMKALYNVPMLQLAREMRYRCRLAMAEVLEGFDLMKKLIQNTDKDLVAHVQQSTRAFQEAVETVEKQVSRNKQLDDISAADGPERDRLLKVLEENLTKTREEEDLDLETIRGVRVMNRNGAEKSRKIFYWLSKATTPASPSLFMRPFESDDYDYGGSVKMNLLYTKEVMSRGENKQGNEEYQILPPPMNLEAMKDYARQLTEYVCCSLRSDAKDEEGKPVPADSSNTDNSTTFHLPVYCVTYTGPDAIGPTVARRNRLIEEGKIEAAENVRENEHITQDVHLATEHQYMYPRGTFIDGDLVYYDLRKGKWVHLWSFLEERNLRRMKQGRVVAKDITALMPCLNDILLGWIKRTLQVAADNNRQAENWLRDPVTNNIIQEGRYHIWSFHHDGHDLFYGLIPKFAKHERKKHKNKSNKSPTSSCPNSAMQSTTNRRKASASFSSESGGEESVTRRKGQEAITTIVPPVSCIAGGATHHSPTASNESSASRKKAETAATKSSGDMGMTGSQGKKTPTGSASSFHNSSNTSQTRADRSGKIPPSSAAPRAAHYNQGSQARQKAAEPRQSTDVYQYGWPAPQRVVYRDAAAQSPPMQTNVPPPLQGGYQPNPRVQNNNYKNKNSNPTFNPNASPNSGATGHLYNAPNMSNAPFSNVQNSFPNPQPNANPSHNRTPNHQFMNPNPAANAYHNFNPNQHANFNTNPNNVHNPNNMSPNQIGGNNNGNYGQRPHHMNVQQAAAPVPQYAGVQRQPAPAPRGGGPETGVQMVYPGNNNNFNNNNNSNNYYNNTTGPTGVVLHGGKKGQRVYCPNNQNNTTVNNMTPVPHTIPAAPQVGQYPPQPSYFPSSNQQSPAPTFNHQHTFHAGYIQPPPSSQPQAPPPPFVPSAVTATAPPPHRGQGQAPSQAYPRGQPQQTAQQRFPHPTGNFNPNASDAHRQGHESQKRNSNYSHNPYDVQP
ncbi:hypothetical protein, conserved [Angomonas deanei]|uniref:Uncharacterized protein n=1 Tax=Angomonas deanei TaxID=59799 RepID=A0A7G2CCA1_9TRYP|nr:hypothetical protein, conserved [Angomonas deanei]